MKYSLQDLLEVEQTLVQGEGLWLTLVALQHAGQTAICGGWSKGRGYDITHKTLADL